MQSCISAWCSWTKPVLQVVNFLQATSQLAQMRLRSVLGQHELDEILSQRESINRTLQTIFDEATDAWGNWASC